MMAWLPLCFAGGMLLGWFGATAWVARRLHVLLAVMSPSQLARLADRVAALRKQRVSL